MGSDDYEAIFRSPEWKRYARSAREDLHPKIRDSALTVQLFSEDPDPKIAMELGYTLLLGKPLLILKRSGQNVPKHLARIANGIVEYDDGQLGTEEFVGRMYAEVERILKAEEQD